MKTSTLVFGVIGSFTVAAGGIIAGLHFEPEAAKELKEIVSGDRGADLTRLRWALFGRVCPANPRDVIRENCFELKSISCGGRNGCACLTDRQGLPGEIDPASLPDCAYRRLGVCRWNDNQGRQQSQILVRPVGWTPPSGTTCSVLVNRALIWDSRANKKDALENALETRCGWPVNGENWFCCPQCLLWSNLCPPCNNLCKYGNAWKGHESECVAT